MLTSYSVFYVDYRQRAYDVSKHERRTTRLELRRLIREGQRDDILLKTACCGHSEKRRAKVRELS